MKKTAHKQETAITIQPAADPRGAPASDGGCSGSFAVLLLVLLVLAIWVVVKGVPCKGCQAPLTGKVFRVKGGGICRRCHERLSLGYGDVYGPHHTVEEIRAEQERRSREEAALAAPLGERDGRLDALGELQFRKFVAGEGGMTLADAGAHLERVGETEKAQLLDAFRRTRQAAARAPSEAADGPQCPKCGKRQATFDRQRFGVGKAAAGAILTGGIGLLAGGIGRNKIVATCFACGHQWKIG